MVGILKLEIPRLAEASRKHLSASWALPLTRMRVVDDSCILFWEDIWIGNLPLASLFPCVCSFPFAISLLFSSLINLLIDNFFSNLND